MVERHFDHSQSVDASRRTPEAPAVEVPQSVEAPEVGVERRVGQLKYTVKEVGGKRILDFGDERFDIRDPNVLDMEYDDRESIERLQEECPECVGDDWSVRLASLIERQTGVRLDHDNLVLPEGTGLKAGRYEEAVVSLPGLAPELGIWKRPGGAMSRMDLLERIRDFQEQYGFMRETQTKMSIGPYECTLYDDGKKRTIVFDGQYEFQFVKDKQIIDGLPARYRSLEMEGFGLDLRDLVFAEANAPRHDVLLQLPGDVKLEEGPDDTVLFTLPQTGLHMAIWKDSKLHHNKVGLAEQMERERAEAALRAATKPE